MKESTVPVVVNTLWEGATPEQYEAYRQVDDLEGNPPAGLMCFVVSFSERGFHITAVYESEEDFKRDLETRVKPAAARLGVQGRPQVEIRSVYSLFAPGDQSIRGAARSKAA